jgi:hypothetical protein
MGKNTRQISQDHAIWLLNVEKALGIDIELGLQGLILDRKYLLWFFNKWVLGWAGALGWYRRGMVG